MNNRDLFKLMEAYGAVYLNEADESAAKFKDNSSEVGGFDKIKGSVAKLSKPPTKSTASAEDHENLVLPVEEPDLEADLDNLDLGDGTAGEEMVKSYADTELPQYSYKTIDMYIRNSYVTKQPLLIYGGSGIGKSTMVASIAKDLASTSFVGGSESIDPKTKQKTGKQRKYINFLKAEPEEIMDCLRNPQNYFALVDVRANELEPSDIKGIPFKTLEQVVGENEDVEAPVSYNQDLWIWLMTRPGSDGILFLDELNQGEKQTLKALFKVVLDRSGGKGKFSEGWAILAAANLASAFGNEPIPLALVTRFESGVLVADPEAWCDFAVHEGVDPRIIAFIKHEVVAPSKEGREGKANIFIPTEDREIKSSRTGDPLPVPRQIEKFSDQLKHAYRIYAKAKKEGKTLPVPPYRYIWDKAAGLLGSAWADEFVNFIKLLRAYDMKSLVGHLDTGGKIEDKYQADMFKIAEFLAGKFAYVSKLLHKNPNSPLTPNEQYILENIAKVFNNLHPEWSQDIFIQLKNRLDKDTLMTVFKYLQTGNYDATEKANFAQKFMKEMQETSSMLSAEAAKRK